MELVVEERKLSLGSMFLPFRNEPFNANAMETKTSSV
jgi:hypothetical protein